VALSHFAGQDEQWFLFEALVVGPEAIDVVVLFYVNHLLRSSNGFDGDVVITTVPEDDKSSVIPAQEQVQGDIAIGR